jgi:abortive infection bacteriophage resistance protein
LYYFDFDLRNLFLRYISRIEINFRTTLVYYTSNVYKNDPYWYVNPAIINREAIESPEFQKALNDLAKEPLIKLDKKAHGKRAYSPAWKALEFMSFGSIIKLYENLKNPHLKCDISNVYRMSHPSQFSNYINTVRKLRNYCAHGKVLFDLNLDEAIGDGPIGNLGNRKTTLCGMYLVFKYLLGTISPNRVKEMEAELLKAFDRIPYKDVKNVIFNNSGFRIEDI